MTICLTLSGCSDEPGETEPGPTMNQPALPTVKMTIAGQPFTLEVAFTRVARGRGLMFRENIGPHEGMFFIFPRREPQDMWMQNCLTSLDMLFIADDGTITQIATLGAPQPGEPPAQVKSGDPVRYVLELAGGRAAELGLKTADRLDLPQTLRTVIPEPDRPGMAW